MGLYLGSEVNGNVYVSFDPLRGSPQKIPQHELKHSLMVPLERRGEDITNLFSAYKEIIETRLEVEREHRGNFIGVFHSPNNLTIYEHAPQTLEEKTIGLAEERSRDSVENPEPVSIGVK